MSLHIVMGPMWAGKSSYLINTIKELKTKGVNYLAITTYLDTRYSKNSICSHTNEKEEAVSCMELLPISLLESYQTANTILIEESQFFPDLYDFVMKAVEKDHKNIICVGLDGDSERKPFGDLLKLIPYCDSVKKLTASCHECGEPALFTYRIPKVLEQIVIGADTLYKPLCRKHYVSGC